MVRYLADKPCRLKRRPYWTPAHAVLEGTFHHRRARRARRVQAQPAPTWAGTRCATRSSLQRQRRRRAGKFCRVRASRHQALTDSCSPRYSAGVSAKLTPDCYVFHSYSNAYFTGPEYQNDYQPLASPAPIQTGRRFTASPLHGNPLAVVLDGADHPTIRCSACALDQPVRNHLSVAAHTCRWGRWADYRVRIFTPGGELPFAGHPTLGSCHAWL